MKCLVCGKEFGLWARMTGDAADQVCGNCENEGVTRLEALVGAIDSAVSPDYPLKNWIDWFNELAARYHVSETRGENLIQKVIDKLVAAVERKELINAPDYRLVASLAEKYSSEFPQRAKELSGRIHRRWNIQAWEAGEPPTMDCTGLLLERAEICHWEESGRLFEQRTRREYIGGSQGISVRLARGVYYRVGAFRGTPIDTAYLADAGPGTVHITNKRICFTGSEQSVAIPYKKIISVAGFEDGFKLHRTGAKKPTILQVAYPELTLRLLALATPAPND